MNNNISWYYLILLAMLELAVNRRGLPSWRANTDGDGKITHGNSFLRLGLLQIISYLANSILQIPAYFQARERIKIQKVISLALSTQRGFFLLGIIKHCISAWSRAKHLSWYDSANPTPGATLVSPPLRVEVSWISVNGWYSAGNFVCSTELLTLKQ